MCKTNKMFGGPLMGGSMLLTGNAAAGYINKAINNAAPSNDLVKLATPGAAIQRRVDYGEAITPRLVGDPGDFFTQTKAQKDAAAYAAGAPQRAQEEALSAANNSLAYIRQRRRTGSALATGAVSGGGMVSQALAYGKSTFG